MPILIRKVKEDYGWMGNMSPHRITYNKKVWRTAEALFQALRFTDEAIQEAIRVETSPLCVKWITKRYGNEVGYAVEPRSPGDLDNLRLVLKLKFEQHPDLARKLKATGDREIIEDCTKRQRGAGVYWGAALQDGVWVGENILGKLLMELRLELQRI